MGFTLFSMVYTVLFDAFRGDSSFQEEILIIPSLDCDFVLVLDFGKNSNLKL